nr:unnamed protein product [Callosobruchus analis]
MKTWRHVIVVVLVSAFVGAQQPPEEGQVAPGNAQGGEPGRPGGQGQGGFGGFGMDGPSLFGGPNGGPNGTDMMLVFPMFPRMNGENGGGGGNRGANDGNGVEGGNNQFFRPFMMSFRPPNFDGFQPGGGPQLSGGGGPRGPNQPPVGGASEGAAGGTTTPEAAEGGATETEGGKRRRRRHIMGCAECGGGGTYVYSVVPAIGYGGAFGYGAGSAGGTWTHTSEVHSTSGQTYNGR